MLTRAMGIWIGVVSSVALSGAAQGELISAVTATASSTASGNAQRAVDGTGMDATNTYHSNATGFWDTHWISAAGDSNVVNAWFKIDLGGEYFLEKILVWNGNDNEDPVTLPARRVGQGDVYVSDKVSPGAVPTNNASNSDWTLVTANYTFAPSAGLAQQPFTDSISLGGLKGRFVALNIDSNGGVDNYGFKFASLAEVQVFSVPEPTTAVLLPAGLIGGVLACVRRKRR